MRAHGEPTRFLVRMLASSEPASGLWGLAVASGLLLGACAPAPGGPEEVRRLAKPVPRIFLEPAPRAALPPGVEPRRVSEKGLALTARMEGYEGDLYEDPAGYCTIGFGHLVRLGLCSPEDVERYRNGLDYDEALELLRTDLRLAERAVMDLVEVELDQGKFDALSDFTYNVGRGRLARSTLLRLLNEGYHGTVPDQLRRYVLANGRKLRGLVVRREEEVARYLAIGAVRRGRAPSQVQLELTPIDILR